MKTVLTKKPCQILGKQLAQLLRVDCCHGSTIDPVDLALENTVGSAFVTAASLENGAPAPVTEEGRSLTNRLLKFILSTQHALIQTLFEDAIVIKESSDGTVCEHGGTTRLLQSEGAAFVALPKKSVMKKGQGRQLSAPRHLGHQPPWNSKIQTMDRTTEPQRDALSGTPDNIRATSLDAEEVSCPSRSGSPRETPQQTLQQGEAVIACRCQNRTPGTGAVGCGRESSSSTHQSCAG